MALISIALFNSLFVYPNIVNYEMYKIYRKVEKIQIIRHLEALFQVCFKKEQEFIRIGSEQNDARATFYKQMTNILNSNIHLMIFSETTLLTEDWWLKKLPIYKISKRIFSTNPQESRRIERGYIDQYLLFLILTLFFIHSNLHLE